MLALVCRLSMYYGIIVQIVFRHIPGLYYYCTTTAVPSVHNKHNNFSTVELTLILLQLGHFEYVFSKIALLHLTSDDDVPLFHAPPS